MNTEKEKFQIISESVPFGMAMLDRDGTIKYVNPKFIELFGYDAANLPHVIEWIMRAYPNLSYTHLVASGWTSGLKSLKPGEKRSYIGKVHCDDGTQKYINFKPVQLETGEILMTCEDITRKKQTEEKIRRRNLELEALNDIIASINSSLYMVEILETLKKVFIEKLDIPIGGIFFYDEPSNGINMQTWWGLSEKMFQDFRAIAMKGFKNERLVKDKEVVLEASSSYSMYYRYTNMRGFQFKCYSHLFVPLLVKGEIQGIILLIRETFDIYSEDQLIFFKALGQQIGVAIENARLFESVRESHKQMQTLSHRLVEIQEAERRYIARELHDEVGQNLTGLKLTLEMSERLSNENAKPGIVEAQSIVGKLMGLVRELSLNLKPAMLDDLGLIPTLLWHLERFTTQTGVQVTFKHTGLNARFPRDVETSAYRIVQEALTNIARHSKTDEATVRLWSDNHTLGVQIEDHGVGFNADAVLNMVGSSGLKGMRERAELLGGQFTLETHPGRGTSLTAELPLGAGSL